MSRPIILERVCVRWTAASPRAPIFSTWLIVGMGLVLLLSGCVTVLKPQPPITIEDLRAGEGVIVGKIHLLYNGKGYESGQRSLDQWSWLMTDQTGRRFRVSGLPINELFLLKAPRGRYRIQSVSFQDGHGKWRGNLQASFAVGEGCTYWGTWNLNLQVGPFTGEASADVVDQVAEASNVLTRLSESQSCPLTTALLETVSQARLELSTRYDFGD